MFTPLGIFHKTSNVMNNMVLSSLVLCHNFAGNNAPKVETERTHHSKWEEPRGYKTGISIYNPLIKEKTKLILQNKNVIKWYSCGPTVYDSAHIGHASSYVKLDIIRRILQDFFDLDVFYLMGITDIDDKIIVRSNEAKEEFCSLARRYEIEFFKDLEKLNVLPPTMTVRVSDHIPEIVSFIERIVEKDYGYKADSGSVYFDVARLASYGKLFPPQHNDNPEKPNQEKHSPLDFTLWKAAKPNEPKWNSPWGPGRPGWHIECSAMASKVLGPRLDIHSGGQDLVFPHHENEEAQSCTHHNTSQWVNYWLHTGHLLVKGDVKMSKSLKNTISISQLLDTYSSNHFRMLCLMSPYRNRIEYSPEVMNTASGTCRRLESFIDDCTLYVSGVKTNAGYIDEAIVFKNIVESKTAVLSHLADDFDTSRVINELLKFVSFVNTLMTGPVKESEPRSVVAVSAASHFIKQTLSCLGYTFASDKASEGDTKRLTAALDATVTFRSTVREVALHPDMAAAVKPQRIQLLQACDVMRNSLSHAGIELKDHAQKSSWNLKDVTPPKPGTKK